MSADELLPAIETGGSGGGGFKGSMGDKGCVTAETLSMV